MGVQRNDHLFSGIMISESSAESSAPLTEFQGNKWNKNTSAIVKLKTFKIISSISSISMD